MNKARRKTISELRERLDALKTAADELESEIETIRDEEQEYFDNMPESLQGGDKGQAAEEAVSHLDTALEAIQEVVSQAEAASDALDSAAE